MAWYYMQEFSKMKTKSDQSLKFYQEYKMENRADMEPLETPEVGCIAQK